MIESCDRTLFQKLLGGGLLTAFYAVVFLKPEWIRKLFGKVLG